MSDVGHELLKNILYSNELEFFSITTLQLIIEFLYTKIKYFLLFLFFPLFLLSVLVQILLITETNKYISGFDIDKKAKTIKYNYKE